MSTIRVDANKFWRDGYILVKGVFSQHQIDHFRQKAYDALERDRREGRLLLTNNTMYPLGDLLSKDGLCDIVLDKTIRSVAEQLLGSEPLYFGNSSFQVGGGLRIAPAWHKDNRFQDRSDRRGLDWTTDRYPIIRFGVYFQDHARHSGGLAIRRGSNHSTRLWRGRPTILPLEPGDVAVWTLTTTHSGYVTRLKFAGNYPLGGQVGARVMKVLPKRVKVPEACERVAAFLTYAKESDHLERYIEHIMTVRAHDELTWFQNSRFGDDVWAKIKESGLRVRKIIPEYGTPLPRTDAAHAAAS